MPFLNIVNEWFLRDCSRKQCAAYQARGHAGKPTTNHAIYGYRKDPEDKHHWLIDEDAAAVVRRIFHLSMEGHGPHKIASILRDDRIERPSVYMGKRGQGTQRNSYDDSRPYDWSGTSVSNILAKPEHMGHTVNFRSYKEMIFTSRFMKNGSRKPSQREESPRPAFLLTRSFGKPIARRNGTARRRGF